MTVTYTLAYFSVLLITAAKMTDCDKHSSLLRLKLLAHFSLVLIMPEKSFKVGDVRFVAALNYNPESLVDVKSPYLSFADLSFKSPVA